MSSHTLGKAFALDWIIENTPKTGACLDVGACDGVWGRQLRERGHFEKLDAVEVFEPNIDGHNLRSIYDTVYPEDIRTFKYKTKYDLVILGDVLEHMTVEQAQAVLKNARRHASRILAAVPFMYRQGAIYGNPYEKHIQDDLTRQNVRERFPELTPLIEFDNYGYYLWEAKA